MVEPGEIYKCEVCGNVVVGNYDGKAPVMCCGQEMTKLESKTQEQEGKEKHVPIIEVNDGKVTVKVGSAPHPMEEKHYISLIQVLSSDGKIVYEKMLKPGDEPVAEFLMENAEGLKAREYCNLHGLWTN